MTVRSGVVDTPFFVDYNTSTPRWSSENEGWKDRKGYAAPRHREVASGKFIVSYTCRAVRSRNRTLQKLLTQVAKSLLDRWMTDAAY